MSQEQKKSEPECKHNPDNWYTNQEGDIQCSDCEDIVKADPNNHVMYDGRAVKLAETATDYGSGRNPRCCNKARFGHFYFCVCAGRSYCPDHGIRCNGSHS